MTPARADGTPRPMRADARRNYDLLLATARQAFDKHGVEASLEDIAKTAGVGIGTLYRHFPTRDALLEALLSTQFEKARASADELLTAADPVAAITTWIRGYVLGATTFRGLPDSVAAVLTDPTSQLYASCHAMQETAIKLLTRAQEEGLVRTDVSAFDAFLMANAISWAGDKVPGDPERTNRLLDLMMDGLRTGTERG